jgi:hypothetical protein
MAPHRRGDQVRVHGQRERGRWTVVRELSQQVTSASVRDASPAELARHSGGEQLVLFERHVILADEAAVSIVGGRPLGEGRAQGMDDIDEALT